MNSFAEVKRANGAQGMGPARQPNGGGVEGLADVSDWVRGKGETEVFPAAGSKPSLRQARIHPPQTDPN
jgi:hypothetical protein